MIVGLASATLDGAGIVYLRQKKYMWAAGQLGLGLVLELLSVPCVAAKAYASLASVSTVVAVVCSRDVHRGLEYGSALALMLVGTVWIAYLSRKDENAVNIDLPIWFYCVIAFVPVVSVPTAAKAFKCKNPAVMRLWEKILLIVADGAVATLNLALLETMTRCKMWTLGCAVTLVAIVNFYTTSASMRVNSVTLHAPIFLVLYLIGAMMLDRQFNNNASFLQFIVPSMCLIGGLIAVLYYENQTT
jgi:hypothetical protein